MVECMVRMKMENRNTTPFLPFKDPRLEMDCCDEIVRSHGNLDFLFQHEGRYSIVVDVSRPEMVRSVRKPFGQSRHIYGKVGGDEYEHRSQSSDVPILRIVYSRIHRLL